VEASQVAYHLAIMILVFRSGLKNSQHFWCICLPMENNFSIFKVAFWDMIGWGYQ
jgi:hypothetical protein